MKLIANKDFANIPGNAIKLPNYVKGADGQPLENHIHKGAQFEVGTAAKFEQLGATDKVLVSQLMVSRSVLAADEANVATINAEVAADQTRADNDAKRAASQSASSSDENIARIVARALKAAGVGQKSNA